MLPIRAWNALLVFHSTFAVSRLCFLFEFDSCKDKKVKPDELLRSGLLCPHKAHELILT